MVGILIENVFSHSSKKRWKDFRIPGRLEEFHTFRLKCDKLIAFPLLFAPSPLHEAFVCHFYLPCGGRFTRTWW